MHFQLAKPGPGGDLSGPYLCGKANAHSATNSKSTFKDQVHYRKCKNCWKVYCVRDIHQQKLFEWEKEVEKITEENINRDEAWITEPADDPNGLDLGDIMDHTTFNVGMALRCILLAAVDNKKRDNLLLARDMINRELNKD